MSRLRIGITTGRQLQDDEWPEFMIDQTPTAYARCIRSIGYLPILIPISGHQNLAQDYIANLDGLIISGGCDINPLIYGEEPRMALSTSDYVRDQWEIALFQAAQKAQLPVLGICRGFQLINVLLGGTLYQDMSEISQQEVSLVQHIKNGSRFIYPQHTIQIKESSILYNLMNKCIEVQVNSYHHQAIKKLGAGLEAVAFSADGLIEAFEQISAEPNPPLLGVQWHPELLAIHQKNMLKLFTWFELFK